MFQNFYTKNHHTFITNTQSEAYLKSVDSLVTLNFKGILTIQSKCLNLNLVQVINSRAVSNFGHRKRPFLVLG